MDGQNVVSLDIRASRGFQYLLAHSLPVMGRRQQSSEEELAGLKR